LVYLRKQAYSRISKKDFQLIARKEPKNALRLPGGEVNLESALNSVSKASKYLMGTDARIIATQQKNTWTVIRHNLGENFSYFWNQMFTHLFEPLQDQVDIVIEYDDTTISIRLKEK
jgi:hypothetical protein